MENKRLLETLKQLHVDLSQAERIDPETLVLLETLTDDIERVLNKRPDAVAAAAEPTSKLRDLLLKFEADHPEFSTAIGKVADGLAAMGF
jgi:ABC-type transporter Mla MlaB component